MRSLRNVANIKTISTILSNALRRRVIQILPFFGVFAGLFGRRISIFGHPPRRRRFPRGTPLSTPDENQCFPYCTSPFRFFPHYYLFYNLSSISSTFPLTFYTSPPRLVDVRSETFLVTYFPVQFLRPFCETTVGPYVVIHDRRTVRSDTVVHYGRIKLLVHFYFCWKLPPRAPQVVQFKIAFISGPLSGFNFRSGYFAILLFLDI